MLSDRPAADVTDWREVLDRGTSVTAAALRERAARVDPEDSAFILYTSGTTGFPKGAVHKHRVIRNAWDHGDRMGLTVNDVILMYLPLFHAFGFIEGPLMSMIRGARQVLTETFDAGQCLDLLARERATIIHGFDTHYKELLDAQERSPRDVSSVRTGICGTGMSSSIPIARRARKTFGNLMTGFGMSEVGIGVTFSFLDSTEEQCVEANGYPGSGYEVRIIDPETGADQPLSVPGEILVRGYIVTPGYYKRPEETARAIDRDGWFHTGDMGLMRPDGHMRFLGRYKDMLKIGGENVDPMEVEAFLMTHPAVQAASVVGLPDARLSEVAVAFVQLAGRPQALRAGGHRALPRPGGELQDSPPRRLRRRVPDDELGQGSEGQAPRAGATGVGLAAAPHLADEPPLDIGHWLNRQPGQPDQGHAGEALVRLDPIEADRRRERFDRGDVDGAPGGIGRIRVRFRDHLDDAHDRALLAGMVEKRLLTFLHGAQVVLGREVADSGPLRALAALRDLLGPRPIIGLGLQQPVRHGSPASFPGTPARVANRPSSSATNERWRRPLVGRPPPDPSGGCRFLHALESRPAAHR